MIRLVNISRVKVNHFWDDCVKIVQEGEEFVFFENSYCWEVKEKKIKRRMEECIRMLILELNTENASNSFSRIGFLRMAYNHNVTTPLQI